MSATDSRSEVVKTPLERREELRSDRVARYARMVEGRVVEEAIRKLHEDGKAWGTTHLAIGQEAVAAGIATALRPTDPLCVAHRVHELALALGVTPEALLAECLGKADGLVGGIGGSIHLTETSVGLMASFTLMGAQIPISVGNALAIRRQGRDDVAVSQFGDGSVNIGAFHEGLNLAAVWRLPVVFLCENNHYNEYTRYDRVTAVADLHRRADAYGMHGEQVDGQDVDEVAARVGAALDRARAGEGPSLLELRTYRWFGHSRSDKATYRDAEEVEAWLGRDPIAIYEARLREEGLLDDAAVSAIRLTTEERVRAAAAAAEAAPEPPPERIFRNVYAKGEEQSWPRRS